MPLQKYFRDPNATPDNENIKKNKISYLMNHQKKVVKKI